jgi:hypothetical protein
MDIFLEPACEWEERPLVSRIAMAACISAASEDELAAELGRLQLQGVRYVALRRQQLLWIHRGRLQAMLADAGMSVSSVGFGGGFTGSMGVSFEESLEDTARAVDLAMELGARSLIVLPGNRGLFTNNHIQRSVRMGLQAAISHAGQYPLTLLVPTSTLLGDGRDMFASPGSMMNWLGRQTGPRVQPLIVVRGSRSSCRLPQGWRDGLAGGGSLRLCRQCGSYQWNRSVLDRLLRVLALKDNRGLESSVASPVVSGSGANAVSAQFPEQS